MTLTGNTDKWVYEYEKIVAAKLHGIHVTEANLNYHGSITLDPEQCELAGILPMEFVDIWNKNSGARISTYVIYRERGSKVCILNGAAARTCQKGDAVIICSSDYIDSSKLTEIEPKVLTYDEHNNVTELLTYKAGRTESGGYTFAIEDKSGDALPIPLDETYRATRFDAPKLSQEHPEFAG